MVEVKNNETWVFIDLVAHRNLSLALMEEFNLRHESRNISYGRAVKLLQIPDRVWY